MNILPPSQPDKDRDDAANVDPQPEQDPPADPKPSDPKKDPDVDDTTPATLEQRLDDLEDLIMVEQAGIMELKKLLEAAPAVAAPQMPEGLEDRVSKMEQTLTALQARPAGVAGPAIPANLESRMQSLERELPAMKQQMQVRPTGAAPTIPANLESRLQSVEKELPLIKQQMQAKPSMPTIPANLEGRMQSLEKNISVIQQQTSAIGRIAEIEKKVSSFSDSIEAVKPLLEKTEKIEKLTTVSKEVASRMDDIRKMKEDAEARIAEQSRKVSERISEMEKVRGDVTKLADNAASMYKQLESKAEIADKIESNVKEMADKVKVFSESYGKFLNYQKTLSESQERISRTMKDLEESKDELKKLASLADTAKEAKEMSEKSARDLQDASVKLEKLKAIEEDVEKQAARIEVFYNTMNKKLDAVKNVEGKLPELMDELANLNKEINKLRVDVADRVTREDIGDKMKQHADEVDKTIKQYQSDIAKKVMSIENKVSGLKPETITLAMQGSLNEFSRKFEDKLHDTESAIDKKIAELQKPYLEDQMRQMLDKLVQLETRILALERVSKQAAAAVPVVLE